MTRELPTPQRDRWQPLRGGLADLFYYDTEEFWFHDGRLLLRGNNGTGKSKVLALLLPFLLDGELSPHRVEPDADPKKKMEWNLLLGGAHPYPERLGYTWLEFGRRDEDGVPHFLTLGCGMKAVAGRGIARHWFFITSQRVGEHLALVDATGTALTHDRLRDALDEHGMLYDRARDYRRAVDEALFGLGEQRYGALVDLLVQLRQPQLSKRPSEKALSAALTEALPPLDQAVVADVAEAFHSLEEDREALREMSDARGAARSFLGHYRRYAQIAARRRARLPREAQAHYRRVNDELNAAESAYREAVEQLGRAETALKKLAGEQTRLRAREQALRTSPEMRSASELAHAADDAQRRAGQAKQLATDRQKAQQTLWRRQQSHDEAVDTLATADERLAAARGSTGDVAGTARIGGEHHDRIDAALDDRSDLCELRRVAERLADRQQRAVTHVGELLDAAERADRALAQARGKTSELDGEADELAQRRVDAERAVAERGDELVAAVRAHLEKATELAVPDPAATLATLELWVQTLDGANPAAAAVAAARQAGADELARADAAAYTRQQLLAERVTELTEEIERLERGENDTPPAAHTRDHTARADRAGAPLWQLVDFTEEVTAADRAGLEAALEAAGILDAWLTPDGELLAADTDDVLLRPGAPATTGLDTVLHPAVDRDDPRAGAVTDAAVSRVLAAIGLGGHGGTWVERDGRFRIGVLEGAWHKPYARYIGRGAREVARRTRLAELRTDLLSVEAERERIADQRQRLRERKNLLAAEAAHLPGDDTLRAAHADLAGLTRQVEHHAAKQARAAAAVASATATAEEAHTAVDEGARDADLPAERTALSEVTDAVHGYRIGLAGLWPAVEAAREARRRTESTAEDLTEAETGLEELTWRAETAAQQAATADEHHRTLRATVGAAVAELQRHLAETAESLRTNDTARQTADRQRVEAIDARGKANGHRETLTTRLAEATEERAAATASFRRFADTGLLAVALPELDFPDPHEPWAPDPTVRLARRVNDELADVDDDDTVWDRVQKRLTEEHKTLTDTLSRQGHRASAQLLEDGVVVEVEFRGRPATVPELAEALSTEVADRELLLNEREREILENHLVNEVASTLQELISDAEDRVGLMNAELERRPTSTGMRLRLSWRPREDGPAGLAEARERLLRQTADAWSEEDRAAVGGFLQARITEVRSRDTAGTWLEHLTEALDYRAWNRFVVQRHQNGQWRSATGPASGGERVLAASVPLFAAASAHYASAGNPHAPRLVTLDEAFAGVDDNARAKYLGLLAAFDLDVVMTSEREWGCYPEVPGLAISQLSRTEDVPAVLVTNWKWDGSRRQRVERPAHRIGGPPSAPAAATGKLWNAG